MPRVHGTTKQPSQWERCAYSSSYCFRLRLLLFISYFFYFYFFFASSLLALRRSKKYIATAAIHSHNLHFTSCFITCSQCGAMRPQIFIRPASLFCAECRNTHARARTSDLTQTHTLCINVQSYCCRSSFSPLVNASTLQVCVWASVSCSS